jgi:hypothetical protein
MTHRILEAMNAYIPKGEDGRWPTRILGKSSHSPVSRLELIETLEFEERERVSLEESGAPIQNRVEQAALVAQLQSALIQHPLTVAAYCVVSTYDPSGTFKPGQEVIWSAHLTRDEALRCLPLWVAHLAHPQNTDTYRVDYRSAPIHYVRQNEWPGPGPRRLR